MIRAINGAVRSIPQTCGAAILSLTLIAAAPPAADPGPPMPFEDAVALGEGGIRANLLDPASAQFEWPYAFTSGTLKALFGKTHAGWYTCGFVNAKNRMGGYTGKEWFLILVNHGQIASLDIGVPDEISQASATCPDLLKKGYLTPAPLPIGSIYNQAPPIPQPLLVAASVGAAAAASKGGLGIAFVPTPAGATIFAVAKNSRAESAGLLPGETINAVNGASIAGLDQAAIQQILKANAADLTLTIVGGRQVKISASN